MKTTIKFFIFGLIFSASASAENDHSKMHHQQMMKMSDSKLVQAGNDIFATIQEVIKTLDNNPDTDWEKVDIEALRQHLIDMNDMALNVDVVSQESLKNGLQVTLQPTTARAEKTLERVFKAHPMHLKRETGWDMLAVKKKGQFVVTVTTQNFGQVKKIIALNYIGLMAYGNHHQPHHWGLSTSQNPHGKHH